MATTPSTSPPILLDLPMPILTPRLMIREPRAGDGPAINAAVLESFAELHQWMPWAQVRPSLDESEAFSRESAAKFVAREDLGLRIWSRDGTRLIGSTGIHPRGWHIRKFEIGYWIRTSEAGKGLITEAVQALTAYAFEHLQAVRIYICADSLNTASRRVAEKAGYALEGIHRNEFAGNDGTLRDMCHYAVIGSANVQSSAN